MYITDFYKKLFGAPEENFFSLDETVGQDISKLSEEENDILKAEFTEKEVHDAIFEMELNRAPGPDGFPVEFYQKCWNVIKKDLMDMFAAFHKGELPLFHLNFGTIILLPKKKRMPFRFNNTVPFVYSM